jgi:transcriptional regulator with PAS, ATPase and Fis domain
MKVLLSWIAFNNDFKDSKVSDESPNLIFHRYFFKHDKHIILSSAADDDIRAVHLSTTIRKEFPGRDIEIRYMGIDDVISLSEVKSKVETVLLENRNNDIDIYFSPGTSIMQLSWYVCHTSLGLKTRLLQTRPPKHTKGKREPELIEIKAEVNKEGYSAAIREQLADEKVIQSGDYIITDSLKLVYQKALKAAQVDKVTCLITGETGTGKEYLAHYIHNQSIRKSKPFIAVNCSAMGDSLLESRLFGYKKGSFTGADKDTEGLFSQANGGTIFLDEIGDISPYMQQSLLRVLQEKEITPIGGKPAKIDVRIVAATHRDLIKFCKEDKFRWDLYYRLNVVELSLPALRDRSANERLEMIHFFMKKKKQQLAKSKQLRLSKDAEKLLLAYPFPGNVRELENIIESLYIFQDEAVMQEHLPERMFMQSPEVSFNWKVAEKELIIRALKAYGGNKRKAQQALGYGSINTLTGKMEEYGIL